eukprot:3339842-Alexandrium_andersonii.AAC.1
MERPRGAEYRLNAICAQRALKYTFKAGWARTIIQTQPKYNLNGAWARTSFEGTSTYRRHDVCCRTASTTAFKHIPNAVCGRTSLNKLRNTSKQTSTDRSIDNKLKRPCAAEQ